ncbi:MAG: PLP-dependent aminotransferase family protein [Paenibacillaceae bacterium]
MLDIILSGKDHGPLYMQLYVHIREQIQSGMLQDGTKLPSIRSLRAQQRFSKTTIETAYQMLIEEGYVLSKPRSGLYVVNPQLSKISKLRIDPIHEILYGSAQEQELELDQVQQKQKLERDQQKLIDFSLLAVDGDSFPTQAWRSVLNDSVSLDDNGNSIHQYGDPRGEYPLRATIAQYLKSSRGVSCIPDQIIIGTGISYSLHILSRLFEQPTSVAFDETGIAQVRDIFQHNGFNIVPFPLHDHELSVTELERHNIRTIYVTPSHRPTGNPLPYAIRQQLLQWAYHNQAYIIEDDYDGEFRYSGLTLPSLQGLDQNGVVIYIGTFSKALTPALRMNYMVMPISLMKKLQSMERLLSGPSRIDQLAMKLFIERGHWYRHIRKIRHIYRKKHAKLIQLIHSNLPNHIQIQGNSGGLHIELTVNTTCSTENLIELALVGGVRVYGSHNAGLRGRTEHPKIYLGFGGISLEDMERGIQLLRKAWSSFL